MTGKSRAEEQFHSRRNSLTEQDINDIVAAFEEKQIRIPHVCRFPGVNEDDFYESVKFFKYVNEGLTSGRNLVGKTLLVLFITFIFGATGVGIVAMIFSKIKGP